MKILIIISIVIFSWGFSFKKKLPIPDIQIQIGPLIPQKLGPPNANIYLVYKDKMINDNFNVHQYPVTCCAPNNLTVFKSTLYDPNLGKVQQYKVPITIKNLMLNSVDIINISSKNYYSHQIMNTSIINVAGTNQLKTNFESTLMVTHECTAQVINKDYWSVIEVRIQLKEFQTVSFQYQFLCDTNFHPNRFDWSSIILVFIASTSIYFLARFGFLQSFKIIFRKAPQRFQPMVTGIARDDEHIFQGFFLNSKHAILYVIIMGLAVILSINYQLPVERVEEFIVMIVVTILSVHFFDECLCQFQDLKMKIFWKIKRRNIASLLLSLILMLSYQYFEKPWFLSDLLSICALGSLVKLYKIVCLEDAVYFFIPIVVFDLIMITYVVFKVRYEWDSVAIRYFNTPLFFQLPYFDYIYKKKCAWISIFNMLFPGFFIGLSFRFGVCKETLVYDIVSFVGLLMGMLTWLTIQSTYSLPLPMSLFTLVPMMGMSAYFAWRRGELKSLWTGKFYDQILLEPFKNDSRYFHGRDSIISVRLFGKNAEEIELKPIPDHLSQGSDDGNQKDQKLVNLTNSGKMNLHNLLFHGLLANDQKV